MRQNPTLVDATRVDISCDCLRYMLQNTCIVAFHAVLRIGETTVHYISGSVTQLADITISSSQVILIFCHFNHNTSRRPVTLSILSVDVQCCPVEALSLFILVATFPVFHRSFLNDALRWAGLDPSEYKSHSFRIGTSTMADELCMLETHNKYMVRWKSNNAFKRYFTYASHDLIKTMSSCSVISRHHF